MKKKKNLFLLFIVAIGISIYSCNVGDQGRITTYPPVVAVIDYNFSMGGITIGTVYGYFAAPTLPSATVGECIYIQQFSVDLDNQPSTNFSTASDFIGVETIDQSGLEVNDKVEIGTSTLLFSMADGGSHLYYNGKLFIAATCKDKSPRYRLVYNSEEEEPNGVKNLYLLANPSTESTSSDFGTLHAFDVFNFVQDLGRDTTIAISNSTESLKLKYIDAKLNYLSEIPVTGEPVYKTTSPFQIFIYK